MPVTHRTGSIFTSEADVLVNTVNCAGVMGAGIAREMRFRYPDMYERYRREAELGRIAIGNVYLDQECSPWILNFPTKKHWRHPSRITYLRSGLEAFTKLVGTVDVSSVAFPLLGASHGGIDPQVSKDLMVAMLGSLSIDIEIWEYDGTAADDLLPLIREALQNLSDSKFAAQSGLGPAIVGKLREAVGHVQQLGQVAELPGFGDRTCERVFDLAMRLKTEPTDPPHPTLLLELDSD